MAEESPRPESEEDAEEEGEEAAEAPVRSVKAETRSDKKGESDEGSGTDPDSPPPTPPGITKEATPPASPTSDSPPAPRSEPSSPDAKPGYPTVSPALYPPKAAAYSGSGVNLFANDGSFLEMFKKKMEATGTKEETKEPEEEKKPEPDKRKPVSFVGKRRGGAKLALKTGIVAKKPKTEEEEILTHKGGAWAQYMAEVKKYKAHQCSDDDKTRPLVK